MSLSKYSVKRWSLMGQQDPLFTRSDTSLRRKDSGRNQALPNQHNHFLNKSVCKSIKQKPHSSGH